MRAVRQRMARTGHAGAVADDFYHLYPGDIKIMQELGARRFRMSVAWPRVFPGGDGALNQPGLDFYSRVVDALLAAGVEPHVTVYHWDLPQVLTWRATSPPRRSACWVWHRGHRAGARPCALASEALAQSSPSMRCGHAELQGEPPVAPRLALATLRAAAAGRACSWGVPYHSLPQQRPAAALAVSP